MTDYIAAFAANDRRALPEGMVWVTAGEGGDSTLVFGSEKTAMMDCGMAYCAKELVANIERELAAHNRNTLDYIFLSHTHYDHMGALPYVLDRWPEAKVCASEKAQYIFTRPGALKVIKSMGENAKELYRGAGCDAEIRIDPLRVDIVLAHGDEISLGDKTVVAIETKGHTDCSMSYGIDPDKVLFASESTGVVVPYGGYVGSEILKSTEDAFTAADRCEAYGAKVIICPHYGVVPQSFNAVYFESGRQDAMKKKAYIKELYDRGLDFDQMLEEYKNHFLDPTRPLEQPIEAFLENAMNTINVMLKEIAE